MRRLLMMVATLLSNNTAFAQDGKECFSEHTKYNVCEDARNIQRMVAASLPMKINANITLSIVGVAGPRVVVDAIWHLKKSNIDSSLLAGGMSLADLDARMSKFTRNSVCSRESMAAFVRLGGRVQYTYRTDDGYVVLAPVVTACGE